MAEWVLGRPPAVGIWVVEMTTKDLTVVTVESDFDDETKQPYLRAETDGFSEPLDDPKSDVYRFSAWSYGPIPKRI